MEQKPAEGRRPGRAGRPPRELAGEVDARILDAACRLFFERGLGGVSMDDIASLASAGKPTIYARFPNKEALFTAVMMRNVEAKIAQFRAFSPSGNSIGERLEDMGRALLGWVMVGDTVGLLRLAIGEARRFPDLAGRVSRMARERGLEVVAPLLAEVARTDELGPVAAFAPERLSATANLFLDFILSPLLIRALLGEKLDVLRAEIEPHVARSVAFFLAGCRQGTGERPAVRS